MHDVYFTYEGPAGVDLVELDTWAFQRAAPPRPVKPLIDEAPPRHGRRLSLQELLVAAPARAARWEFCHASPRELK